MIRIRKMRKTRQMKAIAGTAILAANEINKILLYTSLRSSVGSEFILDSHK